MIYQRKLVVGQYVLGIMNGIMRLITKTVRAQIGHDDAKARFGEHGGMAIFDPIGIGFAEIAVQQNERPTLAQFPYMESDAVGRFECPILHRPRLGRPAHQGKQLEHCL